MESFPCDSMFTTDAQEKMLTSSTIAALPDFDFKDTQFQRILTPATTLPDFDTNDGQWQRSLTPASNFTDDVTALDGQGFALDHGYAVDGLPVERVNFDLGDAYDEDERVAYSPPVESDFTSIDYDALLGPPAVFDIDDIECTLRALAMCFPYDDAEAACKRCNTRFIIEPKEIPGVHSVHELLGMGTFTEVYRCSFRTPSDQMVEVALKLFDQYVCLEETEATLQPQLSHPNLVGLHAVIDGLPCGVALEFCAGGALERFLHGPLKLENFHGFGVPTRLEGARCLVSAVEYLHRCDIVHRDINPANCFLIQQASNGILPTLKLGGLALARHVAPGLTTGWQGRVRYMAPEILAFTPYDVSADIFSFGVLLYELLSSTVPYSDEDVMGEGQLALAIQGGKRLSLDVFSHFHSGAEISNVIAGCWALPAERTSASTLVGQIDHLILVT